MFLFCFGFGFGFGLLPQQPWHRPGDPFRLINLTSLTQSRYSSFQLPPDPCHSPDAVSILHSTALPSHPDPEPFLSLPFLALHSPRHTFVCKITCIAKEKTMFSCTSLPRHTIFREITCVAKGKTRFPVHSCSDTPFSKKDPVSRTKITSAADRTTPKHATQSSDTPFSAKFLVS